MHTSSNSSLSQSMPCLDKKLKQYWPIFQGRKNTTTANVNSDNQNRHDDHILTDSNVLQKVSSSIQQELEEEWQEHIEDCSYWYSKNTLYSSNITPRATTTTTHRNFKNKQQYLYFPNNINTPHGQKITLHNLPTELLCDIFSYLTYTQLTTTLRTVTRRFNTIICDPCNCIISMRRSKLLPKCIPQAPTKFWQIWKERMYTQQRKSMIYSSTRGSRDWGLDIMRHVKYRYTIHHGLNNLIVDVGDLEWRDMSVKDVMYLKRCFDDDGMVMVPCPGFWYGENACEPPRGVVKVIPTLEGQEYSGRGNYIVKKDEMGLDVRGIVESLLYVLNEQKEGVLRSLQRKSRRLGKVTRYRMLLGDLFDYDLDEVDRYSLLAKVNGGEWRDNGVSLCDGGVRLNWSMKDIK